LTRGDDEQRRQRILATVDSIPRGSVSSYGRVADGAGLPRRARLVGRVLRELPEGTDLPWWRVVSADGSIAARDDASAQSAQRRHLVAEGVGFDARGRVLLDDHLWEP
jgi:methylated-DNA-protein-cysteine methyltransferase-like protein